MRRALVLVLGGAALLLNPFFACSSDFRFGLADIEAALAGTWDATWTRDGQTRSMKFRIDVAGATRTQQGARGLVDTAHACTRRTLVKSAGACKDTTTVPLVLVALDGSTVEMTGTLVIVGRHFKHARAELELDGVSISATVMPDGTVANAGAVDAAIVAKLEHVK